MSQRILYLGNKLANKGFTPTGIDTLGPRLEAEGFQLRYASSRRNKVLRLLAMIWAVFKSRNWADYVLIDTYSTQSFWFAYCSGRLCFLLGLAYIPILHGGNLPERLKTSPKASEILFRYACINVAPSAYLMDCFSKNGYKKLINIPNAIDL
ncbi:MAG: glycosyltransferase family 1 protein, partial [Bacteroidota bacterium]|nr:glycosyltransferase family 1 protein [Bacteroidota bacterium]